MLSVDDIKQKALGLGFDLVGITDASPVAADHAERFAEWLDRGYAASMGYMHNHIDKRLSPAELLLGAQSVIVVGFNYKPPPSPPASPATDHKTAPAGRVAAYAQYEDYHVFIKKQLRRLTEFIISLTTDALQFKICVDSVPVLERALASRAGLGFIGKSHILINPRLGPQILLGEIITNLKLQTDTASEANCGDCTKCIDACPTGALRPDGRFDTRRCISYLTTEHKADIPADLAARIGDRLFGCDECTLACPYLKDAPQCANPDFKFYPDRAALNLKEIVDMTPEDFEAKFADSPLLRPGLEKLKKTAHLCLQNISSSRRQNKQKD